MHLNLFLEGNTRDEIYEAYQRDQKKYGKMMLTCNVTAVVLFIIAGSLGVIDGWPWFLVGIVVFYYGLLWNMDITNRNWAMHIIDWQREELADRLLEESFNRDEKSYE